MFSVHFFNRNPLSLLSDGRQVTSVAAASLSHTFSLSLSLSRSLSFDTPLELHYRYFPLQQYRDWLTFWNRIAQRLPNAVYFWMNGCLVLCLVLKKHFFCLAGVRILCTIIPETMSTVCTVSVFIFSVLIQFNFCYSAWLTDIFPDFLNCQN